MINLSRIKNSKEFQKHWTEWAAEINKRNLFPDDSTKDDRLKKASQNPWEMAKIYFPEYVAKKPASFHKEWPKIAGIQNEPVLIEAFRGSGKSTFFTFLECVWEILFGESRFMLFGSYTENKSQVFTGRLLMELEFNQRLREDFGQIINPGTDASAIGNFAAKIDNKRVLVQSCSIGQDPRGLIAGPYRPDYVRLDDIQSRKRAKNREWVKETVNWILADLVPALADNYNFKIIATPVRPRDVVHDLKEKTETRKSVKSFQFSAEDKNGRSTWPSFFPKKRLEKIKSTIGFRLYRQEYLLIPYSEEEGKVLESWLIDYAPEEIQEIDYMVIIHALDPGSYKTSSKNDYKAQICIGINPGPKIDILSARIRRETPRKMINGAYIICEKWHSHFLYWEDNGQQSLLRDTFDFMADKYGYPLPLKAITNTQNKEMRIESTLFTLLENHCIRFHPTNADQKLLKEQLLDLFDGKNDDGPDALELAVRKGLQLLKRLIRGGTNDIQAINRRIVPMGLEGFWP